MTFPSYRCQHSTTTILILLLGASPHDDLASLGLQVCVLEEGGEPSVLAVSVNKELLGLLVHPDLSSLTALTITPNLAVDSRIW